jgi:hypothetical protein
VEQSVEWELAGGNRSTRRKPALVTLCPPQIPYDDLGSNSGHRGGKPTTNRLSYGTASQSVSLRSYRPVFFLMIQLDVFQGDFYREKGCIHFLQGYLSQYSDQATSLRNGIWIPLEAVAFPSASASRPILVDTSPYPMEPWALLLGLKRSERESNQSPLTSPEVKHTWKDAKKLTSKKQTILTVRLLLVSFFAYSLSLKIQYIAQKCIAVDCFYGLKSQYTRIGRVPLEEPASIRTSFPHAADTCWISLLVYGQRILSLCEGTRVH